VASRARRKKVLSAAKGYFGKRKNCYSIANQAVWRSGQNAYRDRRQKKRQFRRLWIARINAAARMHGMSYSQFMASCREKGIELDRKSLAWLAVESPQDFQNIVETVKS
jgi:large subunit ribosomal protein L20